MKRSSPLVRRTPLRARGGSRFPKRRDPSWTAYIRGLPCLIGVGCDGPTECDHVKTRGAGGDDRGNTVSLCRLHHHQRHHLGITSFEARYNVSLRKWAALLGAIGA